jgi:hypothetical protein
MVIAITFFIAGKYDESCSLYHSTLCMTIEYLPVMVDYNVYIVEFLKYNNMISCVTDHAQYGKTLLNLEIELPSSIEINKGYITNELNQLGVKSDIEINIKYIDTPLVEEDPVSKFKITEKHGFVFGLVLTIPIVYIADLVIKYFF